MRDKKERQTISTGWSDSDFWLFFLSCCKSIGCALLSLMPALRFIYIFIFFWTCQLFRLCVGFPHESVGWRQLSAEWNGEERETEGERGCISMHACGLQSVSTSTLGCHHSAQPSPAQNIHAVSRETRTRHILMCDINCTPIVWASRLDSVYCKYSVVCLWWLAWFV